MIKAICFDLDGVYFTSRGKKAFFDNLVGLCQDEEKVIYVLSKSPEMLQFVSGKMTEHDFLNFLRNYLNITLGDREIANLWAKEYEVDQKVREVVLNLRKNGYKTCICSNNNPIRVNALEEKFGFSEDFDAIVFSYKVGAVKPSREIFEELIKQARCKPEEIIYSDDNPDRLQGANDLGIQTFVYIDFESFLRELAGRNIDLH